MLSNFVVSAQRFVLFVDEHGEEKNAHRIVCQLLHEQSQEMSAISTLTLKNALLKGDTLDAILMECSREKKSKLNVFLPPLSDLLCTQQPAVIVPFIRQLVRHPKVQRTFLWASKQHIMHARANYMIAAFTYYADMVVHWQTPKELSIIVRKPGGGVTRRHFHCFITRREFHAVPAYKVKPAVKEPEVSSETVETKGTFKIELDEDELVARNAVKMPYERTTEETKGNIIYLPDANDDVDDEDPDEDLYI